MDRIEEAMKDVGRLINMNNGQSQEAEAMLCRIMAELGRAKEAREWIANMVRCYDRDNVRERQMTRPSGHGVLVHVHHHVAEEGRHIITEKERPKT